jgi:hypothetical protein
VERNSVAENWTRFLLVLHADGMNHYHRTVLKVLFRCANEDLPVDLAMVAQQLELSCVQSDRILEQLDQAGLIDADRVRLTMAGLAFAVSLEPAVSFHSEGPRAKQPNRRARRGVMRLIA